MATSVELMLTEFAKEKSSVEIRLFNHANSKVHYQYLNNYQLEKILEILSINNDKA